MKNILAALIVTCFTVTSFAGFKTVFNEPGFTGKKTLTIENHVIQLIGQAKPGSTIRIGIYDFSRMTIAEAITAASKRGVHVYAVLDGKNLKESKKEGTALHHLKSMTCSSNSCVKYCKGVVTGGCRGWMNNHNKFILFSELNDGRKNVAVISSANWTDGQLGKANDLIQIENDKALFDGLVKYWNDLWARKQNSALVVQGSSAKVYTFPNSSYDPVLEVLNNVSCQLPGSKIRLAQSRFTDNRKKVAQRLMQLAKEGCDVKVLGREEPDMDSPGKDINVILGKHLIVLPENEDTTIHSKVTLISASYKGSRTKDSIVLAGSHNMNGNSLKNNDELLAEIHDSKVFQNYLNYWNGIIKDAVDAGIISP